MKKTKEIKSKRDNITKISIIIIIVGVLIGLITFSEMAEADKKHHVYSICEYVGGDLCDKYTNMSIMEYIKERSQNSYWIALGGIMAGFFAVAVVFYKKYSKQEIIIVDNHVYGKSSFGKTYDLPLKNIVSCETAMLHGLNINTSSEKLKFKFIANNEKLQKTLSELLLKDEKTKASIKDSEDKNIDKLKSYKELLDSGAITEEEYNKKKKDLLDL